jgi:hypothetical protein
MILCRKLREGPSQWKFEAQTDSGTEITSDSQYKMHMVSF